MTVMGKTKKKKKTFSHVPPMVHNSAHLYARLVKEKLICSPVKTLPLKT